MTAKSLAEKKISLSLVKAAKREFGRNFSSKLSSLGFKFSYGYCLLDKEYVIFLRVFLDEEFSDEGLMILEQIVPSNYSFKGYLIPVRIEF